jgi:hypothetical protein
MHGEWKLLLAGGQLRLAAALKLTLGFDAAIMCPQADHPEPGRAAQHSPFEFEFMFETLGSIHGLFDPCVYYRNLKLVGLF